MNGKHRFLRYHLPAILWATALFGGSSLSGDELPAVTTYFWDKFLHAAAFGILALLVERSFHHQDRFPRLRRNSIAAACLCPVLYGVTDEYHQMFVPGRDTTAADVVADGVGALLALLPALLRRRVASPAGNR
jgi:VanZ family protein